MKKILAAVLAPVLCAVLLSGCGGSEKAQEVLTPYFERMQQLTEYNRMSTGSVTVEMSMEDEQMSMHIEQSTSEQGLEQTAFQDINIDYTKSDPIAMKQYLVSNGNTVQIYVHQQGQDQWIKMAENYEVYGAYLNLVGDLSPHAVEDMEKARYEGTDTVRGREAHKISYTLVEEILQNIVDSLWSGLGVQSLIDPDAVKDFYSDIQMTLWIDTETGDLLKTSLHNKGNSKLNISGIELSKMQMEMEYYDYGAAQPLPMPEGAEHAVQYNSGATQQQTPQEDAQDTGPKNADKKPDVLDDIKGEDIPDAENPGNSKP